MQRATQQSRLIAIRILVVMCYVLRRAATIVLWGCLHGPPVGNHRPGSRGVTVHNCSLSPQLEMGELIDDLIRPLHSEYLAARHHLANLFATLPIEAKGFSRGRAGGGWGIVKICGF